MPERPERVLVHAARCAENDHVALQNAWPARLRIIAAPFDPQPATLPAVFAPAFAPLAGDVLRRLALAARLYADAERLEHAGAQAARFEMHALLSELFAGDRRIWERLRALEVRRAWAAVERELYRSGVRAPGGLDDETAAAHARASDPVPRFVAEAMSLLAGDAGRLGVVIEAAGDVAEAEQILRDVRRWRADLAAGHATFATARLARAAGGDASTLYAGGIAGELAARARTLLGHAAASLAGPPALRWPRLDAALADALQICAALDAALASPPPQGAVR